MGPAVGRITVVSGVVIPDGLVASQHEFAGAAGRRFLSELPTLIDTFVDRWRLTVVGPAMHGMAALIVPVERPGGSPAVAKFQLRDEETVGEAIALRVWDGDSAVKLLDHDESTGAMLLERLDTSMSLAIEHAAITARDGVVIIAQLLARLTSVHAPAGIRRLEDIAGQMLDDLPYALSRIDGGEDRRLLVACGDAVTDVVHEAGDRLLHWDLHFDNVLTSHRQPWLAIDPKPLAGDPGFDLFPAIDNLFDADEVMWRFDAMTETIGLDRGRAKLWTLGRVLQNALWNIEDHRPLAADHLNVARQLLATRGR
jgi:streptomycin 6-kinase